MRREGDCRTCFAFQIVRIRTEANYTAFNEANDRYAFFFKM